ncbi:MAG: NusA-like transcription termination signal-binding factor [Nanoarchaeota archaeon]|nr:NusA-like transcription termination signal-binding factor [Nanoarchaeota archaeon]
MSKIKFDIESIKLMTLFETITRSHVKDMIIREGTLIFIVMPGEIGKAIGKKAGNIKKLERISKKKIRIIEYSDDLEKFARNVIMPLKVNNIDIEGKIVTMTSPDSQTRGLIIGRAAVNLRNFESIVKRYFDIDEIKVV